MAQPLNDCKNTHSNMLVTEVKKSLWVCVTRTSLMGGNGRTEKRQKKAVVVTGMMGYM